MKGIQRSSIKYSDDQLNIKTGRDSYGGLFLSPRSKSRYSKIRRDFPEFNLANDR